MSAAPVPLSAGSAEPPCAVHDVALLDLDGVVYVGPDAVPGVPRALAAARTAGMRLGFVTNNASRRLRDPGSASAARARSVAAAAGSPPASSWRPRWYHS